MTKFDLGALIEIGANFSVNNNYVLFVSVSEQQSFVSFTNDKYYPKHGFAFGLVAFSRIQVLDKR